MNVNYADMGNSYSDTHGLRFLSSNVGLGGNLLKRSVKKNRHEKENERGKKAYIKKGMHTRQGNSYTSYFVISVQLL